MDRFLILLKNKNNKYFKTAIVSTEVLFDFLYNDFNHDYALSYLITYMHKIITLSISK